MVEHLHQKNYAELPPGVSVVTAPEEQKELMTKEITRRFAEELLQGTFEPTLELQEQTRGSMHTLLTEQPWNKKDMAERAAIEKTPEHSEVMAYIQESIDHLLSEGRLSLVTVDGNPAGIMGFSKIGSHPTDNRTIFEINRLVVLSEFRGKNLSEALLQKTMARVREIDPHGHLFSYTKSPTHMKALRDAGASDISPELHTSLYGQIDEKKRSEIIDRRKKKQALGWQAMLLDLEKVSEEK